MRVMLRSTILLGGFLAAALATGLAAAPTAEPCAVGRDKTAAPAEILLGEAVTVTLEVTGTCPALEKKAEVVLVIDRSRSMGTGNKLDAAKLAAKTFVAQMDPTLVRIGLVAVSGVAIPILGLTTDHAALTKAIDDLVLDPGTNLVDGLDEARRELIAAGVRPDASRVIIFLTDGRHTTRQPPESDIDRVIAAVRAAGIEVYAVGLGSDADVGLLGRLASTPAHYYFSPTNDDLEGIYLEIAGRIEALVLLKSATLVDEVPANMTFLAGSGRPLEPQASPDGRILTWRLTNVRSPGFTLTYQLRPQAVGTWPTNVTAATDFVDGFDNVGRVVFPVPTVRVTEPKPDVAGCVCRVVRQRVPAAVIKEALAHPERVYGWRYLLDPGKPPGPANPPRECLTLLNVNVDYSPMWNTPVWRVGCP